MSRRGERTPRRAPGRWARAAAIAIAARFDRRFWRAFAPLLVLGTTAPWLIQAAHRYLDDPLFHDATMYLYTGWAFRHGARLYEDIGGPDGPLAHLAQAAVQLLPGAPSDATCRRNELLILALGAGALGATLAPSGEPRPWLRRGQTIGWAWAAIVLWLGGYFGFDHFAAGHRDAYYTLYGILGLAALYVAPRHATSAARWSAAGGFVVALELFGKHTGVVFALLAVLLLALRASPGDDGRGRRARAAAVGAAAAVALMTTVLAARGSFRGMWFWYVVYPLRAYRLVSAIPPLQVLTDTFGAGARPIVVGTVLGGGAMAAGVLPARALPFVLLPGASLVLVSMQSKPWPQYMHAPVGALAGLVLVLLTELWAPSSDRRWSRLRAAGACALLAWIADYNLTRLDLGGWCRNPPPTPEPAPGTEPPPPPPRWADERAAGEYVKGATAPDGRVFFYGVDLHPLLFAERLAAVPHYVNLFSNVQAVAKRSPRRAPMSAAEHAALEQVQARISQDVCARLADTPPAALILEDGAPGGASNAMEDVAKICPYASELLATRYGPERRFGRLRVYLRRDASPPPT